MMKIIIPSMLMMMVMYNYLPMLMMMLSITTTTLLILSTKKMITNSIFLVDQTSYIMMILTLISTTLILLSSSSLKKIMITMMPIFVILMLTFCMKHMIDFYIMFEIVLIPTMILIMIQGKQPERLQASIYLIMYTITASLPLLITITILKNNPSFILSKIMLYSTLTTLPLILAFLVKMPMYFTHLWLPKAHVEAPLEGSMILAAVLLKLGGYGLIRFIPICMKKINQMNYWIISISLIGATATSLNCIRQKDLKSLIAYSSVAHMGLVLTGLFTINPIGLYGAIIMMIAHGMSSSALFFLVNDLYMKYLSRNTLTFKGIMIMMPNITFWWFMFMAINISAPPSINTISEIFLMTSMINWNMITMITIFMASITTTSFSMMMFINLSHNKNNMLPSSPTNQKSFTSLFLHFIPLIILLTNMNMFM